MNIYRFHSIIKKTLDHRQVKFSELLQVLLDITILRTLDADRKAREATIKFPTTKPHPILKQFAKKVTPYALKLAQKEMAVTTTSYATFKVCL